MREDLVSFADDYHRRCLEVLARLIDQRPRARRALERAAGLSTGAITKLLSARAPKLSSVLQLLAVMEIEPSSFFAAVTREAGATEPLLSRLHVALDQIDGGKSPYLTLPPLTEEELTQRISTVVRSILAERERPSD